MGSIQPSFFSNPIVKALDYVPVASTVTNLVQIVNKAMYKPAEEPIGVHTYKRLVRQSEWYWRNVLLLIPVFGNLIVGVYDAYAKNKREMILPLCQKGLILTDENVKELEEAVAYGSVDAMVKLGNFYAGGYNVQPPEGFNNVKQALNFYKEAANAGDGRGLAGIHRLFESLALGVAGVEVLLEALVNEGQTAGIYAAYGLLYLAGSDWKLPLKSETLHKAVNLCLSSPDYEAEFALTRLLKDLVGSKRPDAQVLIEKIMSQGNDRVKVAASCSLIRIALSPQDLRTDTSRFEKALEKCRPNLIYRDVQQVLVELYKDPKHQMRPEAMQVLTSLAEGYKNTDAMKAIGYRYLQGPNEKDSDAINQALKWFTQGHHNLELGKLYKKRNAPGDQNLAFEAFQKASPSQQRLYELALCYLNGEGTSKDQKKAKQLLDECVGHGVTVDDDAEEEARIKAQQILAKLT